MPINLWPNFDVGQAPRSPKSVTEEAGSGLSERTGGRIAFWTLGTSMNHALVDVEFSLYVPTLQYHYPFMRIQFAVNHFYPVRIFADNSQEITASDEMKLTVELEKIFNAPSTVKTIQGLLAITQ